MYLNLPVGRNEEQILRFQHQNIFSLWIMYPSLRPLMMQGLKDMDGAMQYMTAPGTSNGHGSNVEPKNGKPGKLNKDAKDGGNPPKPKEKKVKGMKQQASGKIQVCSAKLTDIKIWSNKVLQSPLSLRFAK